MDNLEKENLYHQIQDEFGKVTYSYTVHIKMAKRLKSINTFWKWAQIILSSCSTVSFIGIFFTDEKICSIIGTILSTLLVIINSYLKELDHSGDAKSHLLTSKSLWIVKNKYISLMTDFDSLSIQEIRKKRDDLLEETHLIYKTELDTDEKAYAAAQKALKNNEEQFFTQQELNKMLPQHLRKDE